MPVCVGERSKPSMLYKQRDLNDNWRPLVRPEAYETIKSLATIRKIHGISGTCTQEDLEIL